MEQAKGNAVSGTTLAQYVHDAVEVERPIRELEGQIEELKKKLADSQEGANQAAEKLRLCSQSLNAHRRIRRRLRPRRSFRKEAI